MTRDHRRPALLAGLVAVVLVTSAVAGTGVAAPTQTAVQEAKQGPETETEPQGNESGEDVVEEFRDALSSVETVRFTRVTETAIDGETSTTEVRVVADLADFQKRTEVVDSEYAGNVTTVTNESTSVTYDADENEVTSYENRAEVLLPMVETLGNESLVTYEYEGTERVDGEETYVLDARPQTERASAQNTSLTVYVDTESYFPRQISSEFEGEDYEYASTVRFENVTLNEEIPDSAFELDVPDDATAPTNAGPDVSSYDSRAALESASDLSVPDPEVPDEFSFESGTIIDGEDYYTASLRYSDGDTWLTLATQEESAIDYEAMDNYDEVEIGDRTGYLYSGDDFVLLHWEDGQTYSVSGRIDAETAIDVAESTLE